KCSIPAHAIQAAAVEGNSTIRAISPDRAATTKKQTTPTGLLSTIPCAGVPVRTPRRPVAIVAAKLAADSIAKKAPSISLAMLATLVFGPPRRNRKLSRLARLCRYAILNAVSAFSRDGDYGPCNGATRGARNCTHHDALWFGSDRGRGCLSCPAKGRGEETSRR